MLKARRLSQFLKLAFLLSTGRKVTELHFGLIQPGTLLYPCWIQIKSPGNMTMSKALKWNHQEKFYKRKGHHYRTSLTLFVFSKRSQFNKMEMSMNFKR